MRGIFSPLWVFSIFVLIALSIFGAAALQCEFIMDDNSQIALNPKVHSIKNWPSIFIGSSLNEAGSEAGIYYKPLMTLAYGIIWQISPDNPFWFHIVQILLHAANALLVYLIFARFFSPRLALFGGLLFLCHPYNAETAIYLADLQDILYMFFGLLAVHFLLRRPALCRRDLAVLFALLMASLLSKESGLLFVFIVTVYGWLFLRPQFRQVGLLTLATGAIYFALRYYVAGLHSLQHDVARIGRAPFSVRLLTAPLALWSYLADFFWPVSFTTTQDWVVETANGSFFWPLLGIGIVLLVSALFGVKKKSAFYWLMFWWVIAGMGFHSHILVPLDGTLAPRWFYFPFVGLCGMILLAAQEFPLPFPRLATALALLLCVGLSVASYTRAMEWRTTYTLFKAEIEKLPDSYVVQNNYGVELFKRQDFEGASQHFQASIDLAPHWTINWNNLGAVYERKGDLQKASELYRHSVENGPYSMAYENYVNILIKLNHLDEAKTFLRESALARFPQDPVLLQYRDALGAY